MKFKTAIAALLAVIGFSTAHAATTDLGTLSLGENTFSGTVAGKESFLDTFNFSLSNLSSISGGASAVLHIRASDFGFSLFDSNNALLATSAGGSDQTITPLSLSSGNYHFTVFGTDTSKKAGAYSGLFSVSAVPEPESYAMFLAGLGLMGVIAKRRRNV